MSGNTNHDLHPEKWVDLYADQLFNFAIVRVSDAEQAQDLVQETFLSALKAKEGFRGESSEKTWLYTILKRKIIDYYRKKSTRGIQENIDSDKIASNYDHYFTGGYEDDWREDTAPQPWVEEQQGLEKKGILSGIEQVFSTIARKMGSCFQHEEFG